MDRCLTDIKAAVASVVVCVDQICCPFGREGLHDVILIFCEGLRNLQKQVYAACRGCSALCRELLIAPISRRCRSWRPERWFRYARCVAPRCRGSSCGKICHYEGPTSFSRQRMSVVESKLLLYSHKVFIFENCHWR